MDSCIPWSLLLFTLPKKGEEFVFLTETLSSMLNSAFLGHSE